MVKGNFSKYKDSSIQKNNRNSLIYEGESWPVWGKDEFLLEWQLMVVEMKCYRRTVGNIKQDRVRNGWKKKRSISI